METDSSTPNDSVAMNTSDKESSIEIQTSPRSPSLFVSQSGSQQSPTERVLANRFSNDAQAPRMSSADLDEMEEMLREARAIATNSLDSRHARALRRWKSVTETRVEEADGESGDELEDEHEQQLQAEEELLQQSISHMGAHNWEFAHGDGEVPAAVHVGLDENDIWEDIADDDVNEDDEGVEDIEDDEANNANENVEEQDRQQAMIDALRAHLQNNENADPNALPEVFGGNIFGDNMANNNFPDALFGEDVDEDELRPLPVMEVRQAVMDLVGIHGDVWGMLRNGAVLAAYCAVVLAISLFLPIKVGRLVNRFAMRLVVNPLSSFLSAVSSQTVTDALTSNEWGTAAIDTAHSSLMRSLVQSVYTTVTQSSTYLFLQELHVRSVAPHCIVSIFDLLTLVLGWFSIALSLFPLRVVLAVVRQVFKDNTFVVTMSVNVSGLLVAVKVVTLLLFRIFSMPVSLGSLLMFSLAQFILPNTREEWLILFSENAVGGVGLCWLSGITFMLCTTLSVLQLREVMHPHILAKIIKPQEAHDELIHSLMEESLFTHSRRMIVSLTVYLLLALLFVVTPLFMMSCSFSLSPFQHFEQTAESISRAANVCAANDVVNCVAVESSFEWTRSFFRLKTWYFADAAQIIIELIITHVSLLSQLEKGKNVIGHMQHRVLCYLCHQLGLTRFLLPLACTVVARNVKVGADDVVVRLSGVDATVYNFQKGQKMELLEEYQVPTNSFDRAASGADTAGASPEISIRKVMIGPPLVRPPHDWDARERRPTDRWAWDKEKPPLLEHLLARPTAPSYWPLRVFALATICWLMCVSALVFVLVVPLTIGRWITRCLVLPIAMQHDPVNFVVGLWCCFKSIVIVSKLTLTGGDTLTDLWSSSPALRAICRRIVLYRSATYVFVGILAHIVGSSPLQFSTWPIADLSASNIVEDSPIISLPALIWVALRLTLTSFFQGMVVVEFYSMVSTSFWGSQVFAKCGLTSLANWSIESGAARSSLTNLLCKPNRCTLEPEIIQQCTHCFDLLVVPVYSRSWWAAMWFLGGSAIVAAVVLRRVDVVGSQEFYAVFHYGFVCWCLLVGCNVLWGPLRAFWKSIEKKVRDDNYLIGNRLVNAPRAETAAGTPPVVTEVDQ